MPVKTTYYLTKEYGNLSCVFRNRLADDVTFLLHGHVLRFFIDLGGVDLGEMQNFLEKSSRWMEEYIEEVFSNTTLVSTNDQFSDLIVSLENEGLVDIRLMAEVGLGEFAKMIKQDFYQVLEDQTNGRLWVEKIRVFGVGEDHYGEA